MKIRYSSCIICGSTNIHNALSAQDHTVSDEIFEIWECNDCTLRFTQNIEDQESIGRYYNSENYISHSDTKKGLINSLYHKVRGKTLNSKYKLIENTTNKQSGKLLDVGAGTGAFLNVMKGHNWEVTGLEPDKNAREKAKNIYGIELQSNENLYNLRENHFDAITLWHVLEHVHTLNEYVIKLKALINKEGKIFIAVPNYTSYDANVYMENWAAYDVPRHLYHFSPKSMKILMNKHGLIIEKMIPMWYDSFYVSMLSEQYKTGKNNYLRAVMTGISSNCKALVNAELGSSIIYIISKRSV